MTEDDVIRLETLEMSAWEDLFAAAPPALAEQLGLVSERIGPALMTFARTIDSPTFCMLLGGGLPGDETGAALGAAVARFREEGLKNYRIHIAPGPNADHLMLKARDLGLIPGRRSLTKFRRGAAPAPGAATFLRILQATRAQAAAFGGVGVAGFNMPPMLSAWFAALPGRANWRCYLAYDGQAPVGCGAAYVSGGGAWLGIGATRPEARGHGSQSAILSRRVDDVLSAGADLLCTETASPAPGEPQTSYDNVKRAGFAVAYERLTFTEAP